MYEAAFFLIAGKLENYEQSAKNVGILLDGDTCYLPSTSAKFKLYYFTNYSLNHENNECIGLLSCFTFVIVRAQKLSDSGD